MLPPFTSIYGVDFSGAKKAGDAIWIARLEPTGGGGRLRRSPRPQFALTALHRLTDLAGTADREPALRYLVAMVLASKSAAWGFDCPFGLPVELFPSECRWADQFALVTEWGDEAYAFGLECIRRARLVGDRMHIRRTTDTDAKTPFDGYHYRIIYQTFYGMRDVVAPLRAAPRTAVLPFQYRKLRTAERVIVESCPGSVLKRLGLPHQNYKQPTGGPLTQRRRLTRHAILTGLTPFVALDDRHRRAAMRNPGGDALDAIIAAVGTALALPAADHRAIARHPRYPREGHLYV